MIGGRAPSKYLSKLERKAGVGSERMDEILGSHVVDPESLRKDEFVAFFQARSGALLKRIEGAMGKPAIQDLVLDEA